MSLQDYIFEKPVIDGLVIFLYTSIGASVPQKAKKIQNYSLISQKNLLKVFIGVLSINKIAKLLVRYGYILLKIIEWQKWLSDFLSNIKVMD